MFRFQKFDVDDDRCAMKVGTDGILLGAWTPLKSSQSILDVGTGSGLLALMLAQRCDARKLSSTTVNPHNDDHQCKNWFIAAIELDVGAVDQAAENVARSPWRHRIDVSCDSLQDFETEIRFDLIVSNPPFFSNCLKPASSGRARARHGVALNREELWRGVNRLANIRGRFCLICPVEDHAMHQEFGLGHGFCLAQLTRVRPGPQKPFKRVLMEFVRSDVSDLGERPTTDELTIEEERHRYTEAYRKLTAGFYLAHK